MSQYQETWSIRKPAVEAGGGVVVTQHYTASRIGAAVLEAGGNAIDAAIAAGFALGAVEPWMSGLGGCGNLMYYSAGEARGYGVSFGVRASESLDPANYPLDGQSGSDLFAWPRVLADRNVHGPYSVAVPGYVAGMSYAAARFGTMPLAELLQPAIGLAKEGMPVDWYASLKIVSSAALLSRYPSSRAVYLPDGFVPAGEWGGPLPRITLHCLADTLQQLADAGARDFYSGELAAALVQDAESFDMPLTAGDLANYKAREVDVDVMQYGNYRVMTMPGMTAGPTLQHALSLIRNKLGSGCPGIDDYRHYAMALVEAYENRLRTMGDANESTSPSCTTHLSVTDKYGNVVALTQTLLSLFGSRVVMPATGVLMNNGNMWFDPRPGRPNSIAPGRWPLSNMCPTIAIGEGRRIALGASGGRRIMPAVFQLLSFISDYGMSLEEAMHCPRVDASGSTEISIDQRLHESVPGELPEGFRVNRAPNGVYPALFACPNLAEFIESSSTSIGAAFVSSPWAEAAAAP